MDLFDCPTQESWNKRLTWLDKELDEANIAPSYLVSDHSVALLMDMQLAFCSGAWISVLVMSISVIDAHFRETEAMDSSIGTAKLLSQYFEGQDIDWLRRLRNKYVHHNVDNPVFGMNDCYSSQEALEENVRKAMKMTIGALFQNPGI